MVLDEVVKDDLIVLFGLGRSEFINGQFSILAECFPFAEIEL